MALNLTDNWQMAKILTDNWHLYPPHPDPQYFIDQVTNLSKHADMLLNLICMANTNH